MCRARGGGGTGGTGSLQSCHGCQLRSCAQLLHCTVQVQRAVAALKRRTSVTDPAADPTDNCGALINTFQWIG